MGSIELTIDFTASNGFRIMSFGTDGGRALYRILAATDNAVQHVILKPISPLPTRMAGHVIN